MPISNPSCQTPSDLNCTDDGVDWAKIYPEMCLRSGSESIPLTKVGTNAWNGFQSGYSYILQCVAAGWLLERVYDGPNGPIVENHFATGGSIPNLIFSGFSTSEEC